MKQVVRELEITRLKKQHDVDLTLKLHFDMLNAKEIIYSDRGDIYPIEIKMNPKPSKPTKNFDVLNKYKKNIQKGIVIDTSDRIRPINEVAWHYPAYLLGV